MMKTNMSFKQANLRIKKGESLALVGPNGVGKSTLLKGIVDKLSFKTGTISFGSNVMVGYYDQEQANLTSNKTVLNELWDDYPSKPEKEIRTALGNFLFSGDDVLKIVSTLSGGEKARLALAKLMLQKANFLILDEPTNHLDLDSKQVLENALIDYPGTLLFVSHDRYFINRIANKIAELSPEGVEEFLGDYDYYVEKKAEIEEIKELENIKANEERTVKVDKQSYKQDKEQKKLMRQRTRRIEEIETEVNKLEAAQAENEELLCNPEIYQNHEEVSRLNGENEKISSQLSTLMEEWEELQLLLEE